MYLLLSLVPQAGTSFVMPRGKELPGPTLCGSSARLKEQGQCSEGGWAGVGSSGGNKPKRSSLHLQPELVSNAERVNRVLRNMKAGNPYHTLLCYFPVLANLLCWKW